MEPFCLPRKCNGRWQPTAVLAKMILPNLQAKEFGRLPFIYMLGLLTPTLQHATSSITISAGNFGQNIWTTHYLTTIMLAAFVFM